MGHAIAKNFLKHHYPVVVWNREPQRAYDLVTKGAHLAHSPSETTAKADIVFEITANDESSRHVWLSADGILTGAHPGQVVITCATLSVSWIEELARECSKRSLDFFDMAMASSRAAAESGELVLLVGGDLERLRQIRPVLGVVAKQVKHFGPAGSGTKCKLIMNTLSSIHAAGFREALLTAKAVGLDVRQVGEALAERPGGAATAQVQQYYHNQPKPINFALKWLAKDLDYTASVASNLEHPLLDCARELCKTALAQGYEDEDWTKMIEVDDRDI